MREKQKSMFERFGATVKMIASDGSITIECIDITDFMKRAYSLKKVTSYTVKNYEYQVYTSKASSDDIIIIKHVFGNLYIMLAPDFVIY